MCRSRAPVFMVTVSLKIFYLLNKDEIKVRLPYPLPSKLHLLFVFQNIPIEAEVSKVSKM